MLKFNKANKNNLILEEERVIVLRSVPEHESYFSAPLNYKYVCLFMLTFEFCLVG